MRFRTRLLIVVAVGLTSWEDTTARASKVTWQKDLQQAVHEASRANKPLLVEFTASWCGYCHKMNQTTFADERVVQHVNGCFIPVSVDADENQTLMQTVGVEALPTTVILSPELKLVKRITGYQTADEFQEHLGTVCRHEEGLELTAVAKPSDRLLDRVPDPAPSAGTAVAFDRLCLVSLRDNRRVWSGRPEFWVEYRGIRTCFVSAEHRRRFEQNPPQYWPVLDGRCPVSAVDEGVSRIGAARYAVVYRGRLWFFADRERQQRFFQSAAGYAGRLEALSERITRSEPADAAQPDDWTPTGQTVSDRR